MTALSHYNHQLTRRRKLTMHELFKIQIQQPITALFSLGGGEMHLQDELKNAPYLQSSSMFVCMSAILLIFVCLCSGFVCMQNKNKKHKQQDRDPTVRSNVTSPDLAKTYCATGNIFSNTHTHACSHVECGGNWSYSVYCIFLFIFINIVYYV